MKAIKIALLSAALPIFCGCNWVALLSVNDSNEEADGSSRNARTSADGRYVVFQSDATNLVANDTYRKTDIFVRDTVTRTTTRVSVNNGGGQAYNGSYDPNISSDGQSVTWWSDAGNLVINDTNADFDVFVHNRFNGHTSRVSVDSAGNQSNGASVKPSITGDGRYVCFGSDANNLVEADTNNDRDVFVHDRFTGLTSRVSLDSDENQANDISGECSISNDGRYVSFLSSATNLVEEDTNDRTDIYVKDRLTGVTTRVSDDSAGNQGNNHALYGSLSGDGRFVVFASDATNLVANDTNGTRDIFVHDRTTGATTRVSVDSDGKQANGRSTYPRISHDGRYVVYSSSSTDLVADDFNGFYDVFLHDRDTGNTSRVSLDALGLESNGTSPESAISANGRYVVFTSGATNLIPGGSNGAGHIYIRAIPELTVAAVVPNMLPIGATTSVTITGTNFLSDATPVVNEAALSNIVVVDENTITLDITVPAAQTPGARNLMVNLYGTGPGVLKGSAAICSGCITFM
jgi:hypothetical protein